MNEVIEKDLEEYKKRMSSLGRKLKNGFTSHLDDNSSVALKDLSVVMKLVDKVYLKKAIYGDKKMLLDLFESIIHMSKDKDGKFYSKDDQKMFLDSHTKRLDKLTPHLVPIGIVERKKMVKSAEKLLKEISERDLGEEGHQRACSALYVAIALLKHGCNNNNVSRDFGKTLGKMKNSNRVPTNLFSMVNNYPSSPYYIEDIIREFPSLFENSFFRTVLIENEFLDAIYYRCTSGESFDYAAKKVIQGYSLKNIRVELKILMKSIQFHWEKGYVVAKKKKGNMLSPFQAEAIARFCESSKSYCFNFDEPGTRKTATSVIAMVLKLRAAGITSGRIIVVSPINNFNTWEDEIKDRMREEVVQSRNIHEATLRGESSKPDLECAFVIDIVGPTVFSSKKIIAEEYDGIIIDEIHNFKQREGTVKSIRSQEVANFASKIKYRMMLSGTPLINDPSEYAWIINAFGENEIDINKLKSIYNHIERACWLHFQTGDIVIRRRKNSIMKLPSLIVHEDEIVLGKKRMLEENQIKCAKNDMAMIVQIAIFEAISKIPYLRSVIKKHSKSKGLVFTNYIKGDDERGSASEGVLKKLFDNCPRRVKKIYIAGDCIVDISGKKLPYNKKNAISTRKQFEEYDGVVVGYVSLKTCREGINEFSSADYLVHAILPYDPAQFEQANARIYRCGRDENKDCHIYIPCVVFKQRGNSFYVEDRKIKSFDESILGLIKKKKKLLNASCDGVKRHLNGDIESWGVDEKAFGDLLKYVKDEKNINTKVNVNKYISLMMGKLQEIHDIDLTREIIEECNQLCLKHSGKDYFDSMEHGLNPSIAARKIFVNEVKSFIKEQDTIMEGAEVIHIGCGACDISKDLSKYPVKLKRFDKYCQKDGIINCDRSEIMDVEGGCEKEKSIFVAAPNVLHWSPTPENIHATMMSINETLVFGGRFLIISPENYDCKFAVNKKFLKNLGFTILKKEDVSGMTTYLLEKVSNHKECDIMATNLLPKKRP